MWTVTQLLEATQGELIRGGCNDSIAGIAIDSRRLVAGEAFVAIQGRRLDGHDFIKEAVQQGASCLLVSESSVLQKHSLNGMPAIRVADTTQALGELARYHRRRIGLSVVAVTGSCGKTTTKDLIAHLLGAFGSVLKTEGNQNNHIGVPLSLLRIRPDHQVAVVECR